MVKRAAAFLMAAVLFMAGPVSGSSGAESIPGAASGAESMPGTASGAESMPGTVSGAEIPAGELPMDPSVMKPWLNSCVAGMVTEETFADAKDDLYLNTNRDWILQAKFRPGFSSEMPLIDAMDTVKERCLGLLSDKTLKGSDAETIQAFYELWLDWDARNAAGIDPFLPLIEKLTAVQTIDELSEFLLSEENHRLGYVPAPVTVGTNAKDSTLYEVKIPSTSLLLGDPAEYEELTPNGERIKKANEELLRYMFGRTGLADSADEIMESAYELEKKLAEFRATSLEQADPAWLQKSINPVTFEEIREMSPAYPLAEYMEKYGWSASELYNLMEPDWLSGLNGLYTEENLAGLKNLILEHILMGMFQVTDEDAFRTFNRIINSLYGVEENPPDEETAYEACLGTFPDKFARLYVEKYLNEDIRSEIRTLCEEIIGVYREMLSGNEWLSEETKAKAIEKLDKMTIHAVYPDRWQDDSMYVVTPKADGGTYLDAVIAISEAQEKEMLGHLGGRVDEELWTVNILETNAFYNPQENSINIIPGFFCDATYRSDMSLEEKYGALGSVIGHEISHAFDTSGSQFDGDGNVADWWTEEDKAAFQERAQKLVSYFDQVVAFDDGTPYQGQMVQTEAIADLTGLKCMLKIAEKTEGFDYEKFFRAYVRLWARIDSPETAEALAMQDSHPLHYLRANVTVQQFDEFYEAFGVREGDGMYLAPEDRILIW